MERLNMAGRNKVGKILAVIFITGLIWVWADLAKTEEFPVTNAVIRIAESTDPNTWVSFESGATVTIQEIVFKAAVAKRTTVESKLSEGSLDLDFLLYPAQQGMDEPGKHNLDVVAFLQASAKLKPFGLTVQSCEPKTLVVNVTTLVKKTIKVECFDTEGEAIADAQVNPANVEMYVPGDWLRGAEVQLSPFEIREARLAPIGKVPYVKFPGGQMRKSNTKVQITLSGIEEELPEHTITTATPGWVLSTSLVGEYDVDPLNMPDLATVTIFATPAAKLRYMNQPFQMLVYIEDEDAQTTEAQKRPVVYNFPKEFVQKGEIRLKGQPAIAEFKLVKLAPLPAPAPSGGS